MYFLTPGVHEPHTSEIKEKTFWSSICSNWKVLLYFIVLLSYVLHQISRSLFSLKDASTPAPLALTLLPTLFNNFLSSNVLKRTNGTVPSPFPSSQQSRTYWPMVSNVSITPTFLSSYSALQIPSRHRRFFLRPCFFYKRSHFYVHGPWPMNLPPLWS